MQRTFLLTLSYLIEPHQRRGSEQAVWEEILRALAQRQDIDFAYPTQHFYINMAEGRENARAKPLFRSEPPPPLP